MAEEDRVVFPDEVEEVKEKSEEVEEVEEKKEEVTEETAVPVEASSIQSRNMITVPGNCPPGYQRGADGVCRQVF